MTMNFAQKEKVLKYLKTLFREFFSICDNTKIKDNNELKKMFKDCTESIGYEMNVEDVDKLTIEEVKEIHEKGHFYIKGWKPKLKAMF